jgi:hypothetical protein
MAQPVLPIEILTQLLDLPDSWVIFDVKKENNEIWIYLKEKGISSLDNSKTETLRHLEIFENRTYIKLYFLNEEGLNKLPLYTKTGFCKPFIMDVMKMFGRATDASICNLYGLTKKELNKIKKECNADFLA